MNRLITPGFFAGGFAGILAGAWFGLHPEAQAGWLIAIALVSGVAVMVPLVLLGALRGILSVLVWFVVIMAVPFGVAAAGAWLAGGVEVPVAQPPDLAAGSSGGFSRIATWVGYAIGALLGGFLLVGAGMTAFARAREQPRLAAARQLAAEGKLETALAICERAVGKGPVDGYASKSGACREMARLAVVLLHRLGRQEDARRHYAAIEAQWTREVALLAEEIGLPDRALEIWETLARRRETREEDLPRIERLRDGPQAGT